ncbi:MAG: class I SAM-dependent rRNA methyltransferase [Ignavibacteriae bacterium]|nr:MAG: class I SAM-dependent rRNA methyltransferase [Ignavibacteriota bacterium]
MKNQIVLKKNEEHRLAAGHQWVFSNEIAALRGTPEIGEVVELLRHDQKVLGQGFYHPHSLIAFRFLTSEQEEIGYSFFERRIQQSLALRQKLYPGAETYRLVHGEGDFLPGLIIDKFNEFLSLQILSAGMDRQTETLCDVLETMFHPKAIVARNDAAIRTLEELPLEKKVLRGNTGITIIDDGVKFEVDVLNGQKTGFFLDQRENRKAIHRYAVGGHVLDCFCNEGGFALHAASARAASVRGCDISEQAIAKSKVNARLNSADVEFETGDVSESLKLLGEKNKKFDMIILDPPSFTKSKKNIPAALRGYKDLNAAAMRLIQSGGYLVTASCSHHITEDGFLSAIEQAAVKAKRQVQLLEFAGAAPDHPVIPAMPETKYLKFAIFTVR